MERWSNKRFKTGKEDVGISCPEVGRDALV